MNSLNLEEMSKIQLVTHALTLELTAPSEELSWQCCDIAESFASGLSFTELEACKAAALAIAESNIRGKA